jgi:putative sugar O-methyltransferase
VLRDYAVWSDLVGEATPSVLSPPPVGDPWGYVVDGKVVMADSLRHDSYAWRAHDLLAGIDRPVVAEIGGGYGGFAYFLLMRSGNATYINFDLPEILVMASYYLMSVFPEKKILLFGESPHSRIDQDTIVSHDIVLMPNHQLPGLASESVDLFVNTRSLSEMSYNTVAEYLRQVGRTCRRYFFHENSNTEKEKPGGHVEVPSSRFPMPEGVFRRIYRAPSPWAGGRSRYWEHLYERTVA